MTTYTKLCRNCFDHKDATLFREHPDTIDGRAVWCKDCVDKYNQAANANKLRKAMEFYGGVCNLCGTEHDLKLTSKGKLKVTAGLIAEVGRLGRTTKVELQILCSNCSKERSQGFPNSPEFDAERAAGTAKQNVQYESLEGKFVTWI